MNIELEIYSEADSGDFILSSSLYLRTLFCMILVGVATITKRTIISLRFGKRLLNQFKVRMEKLLADIIIMNEIAILADQVEHVVSSVGTTTTEVVPPSSTSTPPASHRTATETASQPILPTSSTNKSIDKSERLVAAADSKEEEYAIMKEVVNWTVGQEDEMIPADNIVHHQEMNLTHEKSQPSDQPPPTTAVPRNSSSNTATPPTSGTTMTRQEGYDPWEDPVEAMKNKVRVFFCFIFRFIWP
jgi:hypothetical protein